MPRYKDGWYQDYLFVYGTLKRGFWNNDILAKSIFVRETYTSPHFDLKLINSIPILIDGEYTIKGELYLVDDNVLRITDQLEGHPNAYKRERIVVAGGLDGIEAYAYIGNKIREHANRDVELNEDGVKEYVQRAF